MTLDLHGNMHNQLGRFTGRMLAETDPETTLGSAGEDVPPCGRCHKPFREVGALNDDGLCEGCELDTHCSECGEPITTLLWGGLCERCLDRFEPKDVDPDYGRGRRHR